MSWRTVGRVLGERIVPALVGGILLLLADAGLLDGRFVEALQAVPSVS